MTILKKIFGTKGDRDIKQIQPLVKRINELDEEYKSLSEDQLKAKTAEFKERLAKGEALDSLTCEAFAVVKNACRRLVGSEFDVCDHPMVWDMVPFDCQLVGGVVLHQGKIAEMATGEGKTLVATMPLYLNSLTGRSVHLVTVNDYLARRDSQWMGHLFEYLGVSVGCLQNRMMHDQRSIEYGKDITYGTNSEFGFDYLRDNGMAYEPEGLVQRGYYFAIIDETDSILIDEARTPLIISGPVPVSSHQYFELKPSVDRLVKKQRSLCNDLVKEAKALLEKDENLELAQFKMYQINHGMPKHKQFMHMMEDPSVRKLHEQIENAMLTDMRKDQSRSLREELYFTIDERGHDASLTEMGCAALNPGDPDSFVMPDLVSAMSEIDGDSSLSEDEKNRKRQKVQQQFSEKSERIHNVDQLIRAYCLYEKDTEYVVQGNQVMIVDEFTGRIMHGRRWSDGLHQAVEAKEGVKIERETQTLATITIQNYFRMYDKLAGMTGTAETEAGEFSSIYGLDVVVIPTNRPVRRVDANDVIYKTQREKYKAVIDDIKLRHASGQPVLVGTATVDTSELISRMLKREKITHNVLNAKNHEGEADIVSRAGRAGAVTIATNMAGRGTDIKLGEGTVHLDRQIIESKASLKDTMESGKTMLDTLLEEPSGLHVIGSERHESRRIDRQLRGRCARQGDPGSSKFYVSLEDDLMRLFGSDRIAGIMSRLGLEEGQELEHSWLNRSIETAQKRIEQQNFGIRKRTLEYDDVMNIQREIVYGFRGDIVRSEAVREYIYDIINDVIDDNVAGLSAGDTDGMNNFLEWVHVTFPIALSDKDIKDKLGNAKEVSELVYGRVQRAYDLKVSLEDPAFVEVMERQIILQAVDSQWQDFLRGMDALRQGVGLRAYGQRDPLVEYKREAFDMFDVLMSDIKQEIVTTIFRSSTSTESFNNFMTSLPQTLVHDEVSILGSAASASQSGSALPGGLPVINPQGSTSPDASQVVRDDPKVGRNDPCPCGSGKKYKKCCGV